jgi:hypothetical protein
LFNQNNDFKLKSLISDGDIIFQGNDGGVGFTALTLDMSAAGFATFNNGIKAGRDISAFGANTGSSANRMALSMEGSGVSRLICNGPDMSTNGTFEVFTAVSGGTGSVKLGIDATGDVTVPGKILVNTDIRLGSEGVRLSSDGNGEFGVGYGQTATNSRFTVYNNTAAAFRVLPSGNVGIGTASPAATLDVKRDTNTGNNLDSLGFDVAGIIGNAGSNPGNHYSSGIRVFQGSGSVGSGLGVFNIGVDNGTATTENQYTAQLIAPSGMTGGISLSTGGSGRMRIAANGNVGIGVTDPDVRLEVKGISAVPSITAQIFSVTNTVGGTRLDLGVQENTIAWLQSREGSTLRNLALNPLGGNVGIGTSSPAAKLHVAATGTASLASATINEVSDFAVAARVGFSGLTNNNDGAYFGMGVDGGISAGMGFFREGSGWSSALSFYTNNQTSGTYGVDAIQEQMRITSAGNVGIGTASPTGKLHVSGGKAGVISDDSSWGQFRVGNTSDGEVGIAYVNGATESDFLADTDPTCAYKVIMGLSPYGAGARNFGIGNDTMLNYHTIWTEAGHQLPRITNTYDLGSASKGFRNIYTNDLNLSNMPADGLDTDGNAYTRPGNDVDGTNGSWTIQEGANDLFIINRLNGKKYKFNLTEVVE